MVSKWIILTLFCMIWRYINKPNYWIVCLQVTHVEPWEKGSRKTAGQTGMCGGVSEKYVLFIFPIFPPVSNRPNEVGWWDLEHTGGQTAFPVYPRVCFQSFSRSHSVIWCPLVWQVRGVGTGGIVSTAFCLLYKLFTLKLTRKQLMGLITHTDSPYIRALGFMYIRYDCFYNLSLVIIIIHLSVYWISIIQYTFFLLQNFSCYIKTAQ